jgi:hypothetical protein
VDPVLTSEEWNNKQSLEAKLKQYYSVDKLRRSGWRRDKYFVRLRSTGRNYLLHDLEASKFIAA